MGYDENFYRRYGDYLQEAMVRHNHDLMFDLFSRVGPKPLNVVDFGSGTGEYPCFDKKHDCYLGVDREKTGARNNFMQINYMEESLEGKIPFEPTAFISLFSTECCNPTDEKYELYDRIFREHPSISMGMVSGFYYESKKDDPVVFETGGIKSYQSTECPLYVRSPFFTELRTFMHTPSKMFGNDVVEVWKFLFRR